MANPAFEAVRTMLVLTAWADGVGSNWVGFGGLEGIARLVGLPDAYEAIAVLPFATPSGPWAKERRTGSRSVKSPPPSVLAHLSYSV